MTTATGALNYPGSGARHGAPCLREDALATAVARWLLLVGYGTDFSFTTAGLPPGEVLERMVSLAADDPDPRIRESWGDGLTRAEARWCLEQELGEWEKPL